MKYVVKEVYDPSIDVVRYGVYDNQYLDPIHNSGDVQNLILLLDEREHADMICHILNLEDDPQYK